MALYDEYEPQDEMTRRQRRDEASYNSGGTTAVDTRPWWQRSGLMGDNGIGTPESGYGPGGVDNPAYTSGTTPPAQPVKQATADENTNMIGKITEPPPGPTGPSQPAFQAPQAAPAMAPAPAQMKQPGITDEVTKILMARLNDLKNPGDVQSDPIYQQAVRAYQVGQLRSADRERKALAERSAASGTRSSGGFNVGVQGINERAGERSSQYRSGLALDRLSARESQLNEAIKMARAVGQDDIANQLEVQRLALQQELGRGDLALRSELGRGQLGLGQDTLGFNYADLIARMNRDAVLAGLGGGG